MNVFLSASVPQADRDPAFLETADVVAIREAIKGLVLVLLERNGHLVFGGHPAITPLVRLLFNEAGRSPRQNVTLYQSALFRKDFPPDNAAFENVVIVPSVDNDRVRSLERMREQMLGNEHYDYGVFIGGMEGVIEEFMMFRKLQPNAPVFPIASTGAAAAMLYSEYDGRRPELEHELTYPTLFRRLLPTSQQMDQNTYEISIYFGAPTYQDESEGRARKAELEAELGLRGEEASIGTGAEGPGIVFLLDVTELVAKYGLIGWGALNLGKNIVGVVDFYLDAAKKLKKYVSGHHTYLEQDGAYVLAVDAIIEHLGKAPKSIVLEGYMTGDPAGDDWDHMLEVTEIGKAPPHLGAFLPHHFQFKIDGRRRIKVVVDSDDVKVFELPDERKSASKRKPSKKKKAASKKQPSKKSKATLKSKPSKKKKAASSRVVRRTPPKRRTSG